MTAGSEIKNTFSVYLHFAKSTEVTLQMTNESLDINTLYFSF